ncbi:MAG: ATP-binding cassette domain-containing protein, partial [Lachnospiraceae bacterium]
KIRILGKDVFNCTPKETFDAGISSIPADRHKHGLVLDFSNEDNMILQHFNEEPFARKGFLNRKAIRQHAAALMEKFDIRPRGAEGRPAATLSGGNQQKVIIAREITNDKELLIAVNPTRGLDVGAIEFVHKYLVEQRNKNRAVLLVSFELDEIMSLSDRIMVISEGKITGTVSGEEIASKKTDEKELGFLMAGGKRA